MRILIICLFLILITSCFASKSAGGVNLIGLPLTQDEQSAIEAGINKTLIKARCRGYSNNLSLNKFTVEIVDGELDSAGNPAIKQPCGAYCGTVYDKGGYILVAGFHKVDVFGQKLVLPKPNGNLAYLELTSEFESEHQVLHENDKQTYESTRVHTAEHGHPIIPNCL